MARVADEATKYQFQSTRPRRARLFEQLHPGSFAVVSIHAPAEGATGCYSCPDHRHHVSIHAPAEGATSSAQHPHATRSSFNPRARGGRDRCRKAVSVVSACFNPRARGGRDLRPVQAVGVVP